MSFLPKFLTLPFVLNLKYSLGNANDSKFCHEKINTRRFHVMLFSRFQTVTPFPSRGTQRTSCYTLYTITITKKVMDVSFTVDLNDLR